MLRISKLSDYAIIVLGHMARDPDRVFAANDLAGRAKIAPPTVSKVLKALVKAKIVHSTRGAKGGYQLTRAPSATPIASIIAALEGPIALTECGLGSTRCEQSGSCDVRGNWSVLNGAIQTALESVTLEDMAVPMKKAPERFRIVIRNLAQPASGCISE